MKSKLGEGSFGKVYGDGRLAIKIMNVQKRGMEYTLTNHELAGMLTFDDLNIVQTYPQGCFIRDNGLKYEVWVKLVQYQGSFDDLLKDYNLRNNNIWKIDQIFKIISSVKKLHDNKICHLDLKEMNVFSLNKYTPVLGDLGMMHSIEEAKRQGLSVGTPLYLGEHVFKYKKPLEFDQCKVDVYALGVIMFQIIAGM